MSIRIAERLKPFCHIPGTACILPGSNYQIEAFPTRLRIYDVSASSLLYKTELRFDVQGPLRDFTVQNDLEKGVIRVWGKTSTGFLRYQLQSYRNGKDICLQIDKTPSQGIGIEQENQYRLLQAKESFLLFQSELPNPQNLFHPSFLERLSLGNHKAQDGQLMQRRLDLTEIFPIWHRLGQLITPQPAYQGQVEGTLSLLQACREAMEKSKPEYLVSAWAHLFLAGFKSLFVPRLYDDTYQGLMQQEANFPYTVSPLVLLTQAVPLIRELFFQYKAAHIKLLPLLPPEFAQGRLLGIQIPEGTLAIEWTKKVIRSVEVHVNPLKDIDLTFHFRHVKECRLRKNKSDSGQAVLSGKSIFLEKNCRYFFDNFR